MDSETLLVPIQPHGLFDLNSITSISRVGASIEVTLYQVEKAIELPYSTPDDAKLALTIFQEAIDQVTRDPTTVHVLTETATHQLLTVIDTPSITHLAMATNVRDTVDDAIVVWKHGVSVRLDKTKKPLELGFDKLDDAIRCYGLIRDTILRAVTEANATMLFGSYDNDNVSERQSVTHRRITFRKI